MKGVIAAIATPFDENFEPIKSLFLDHARLLLEEGCDGLNVLGTTGEATSLSLDIRRQLMKIAAANLPAERMLVGTGAAALEDCLALTLTAAELGFGGALVLPPFYYKDVSDDGLFAFVSAILNGTAREPIPLYLYNFPQMTGITWTKPLIARLLDRHGGRIAGLKDSSGDVNYASDLANAWPNFSVFPSNEACLIDAANGHFSGCISATANLNARLCGEAFRNKERTALDAAVQIRSLFSGRPLVAGVKSALAVLRGNVEWRRVLPPLVSWTREEAESLVPLERHSGRQ